jgi:Tol biopolymer transport system component
LVLRSGIRSWEEYWPTDWSADGVLFERGTNRESIDLWMLPIDGDRTPYPVVVDAGQQSDAKISPNGRWVAYAQREFGSTSRPEIYVQNLAVKGAKHRISIAGGRGPRWRSDGQELFYVAADGQLVAVSLDANAPNLQPGAPQNLFKTGLTALGGGGGLFGVSPDGQRFLLRLADERDRPASIIVVANWPAALDRTAR